MRLDDIDLKILTILQENSNITNLDLSKAIGLSTASTLDRVRKIHKANLIKGYHAELNKEAFGFNFEALILVTLENHKEDTIERFIHKLKRIESILECKRTLGIADFYIRAIASTSENLQNKTINSLNRFDEIEKVITLSITSTIKDGKKISLNHIVLNG